MVTTIKQPFYQYLFVLLCVASAVSAEPCSFGNPCYDTDAYCDSGYCKCKYGYDRSYYSDGDILCTYSSRVNVSAVVIPVTVISIIIGIIIWYLLRRRRLAGIVTQTSVWVQPPLTTMGVPVASQSHPSAYPTQQHQPGPSAGYPTQQQVPPPAYPTQQYQPEPPPAYSTQQYTTAPPPEYQTHQHPSAPSAGFSNPGFSNPGFMNPELVNQEKSRVS